MLLPEQDCFRKQGGDVATVTVQIEAQRSRSSCCRCREPIVQGIIAETHETWVTAKESDPWCQGGAHLPKAAHLNGW